MNPTENPFASLTLIVAPAMLTNASTVLVLSTSNRLARTLDRARKLADQVEQTNTTGALPEDMFLRELHSAEERTVILMKALQTFYAALGGFAGAAFLSLIGAVLTRTPGVFLQTVEWIAIGVGSVAVASLIYGAFLLMKETRIAVHVLHEQAIHVQSIVKKRLDSTPLSGGPS